MDELKDTDPFPFGNRFKGVPMQDVDPKYLHWVWHNASGKHVDPVHRYIRKSIDALRMENRDLIWDLSLHK